MCVILVSDTKRPTSEMVEKAFNHNSHGGGAAWREGEFVRWEKGLKLEDMIEHAKKLPLPFVLHFRIASTGGRSDYLCHPFEVSRLANYKLEGKTKNPVLFHNGTWNVWRHELKTAVINSRVGKLPTGPWNDTRGLAFMAYAFGGGILEMINEKTVLFSPKELEVFGDGWEEESDILMSNTHFLKGFRGNGQATYPQSWPGAGNIPARAGVASGVRDVSGLNTPDSTKKETIHVVTASERAKGGPSLDIPFRGSIEVVGRAEDLQEPVEENPEQVLGSNGGSGKKLTAAEERLLKEWATAQNPKEYRTRSVADHEEFNRRIDLANKGIEYVGRM